VYKKYYTSTNAALGPPTSISLTNYPFQESYFEKLKHSKHTTKQNDSSEFTFNKCYNMQIINKITVFAISTNFCARAHTQRTHFINL
jgi:hypothetical protein